MKPILAFFLLLLPAMLCAAIPDSVYIKPVCIDKNKGMRLMWSSDGTTWSDALQGVVVASDYGSWGGDKRLFCPSLTVGCDGMLALVFQVDDVANQFAVSSSRDLIHWRPQDYPLMEGVGQCLAPVITYSAEEYEIVFHNKKNEYFATRSADLATFSSPQRVPAPPAASMVRVPYALVERLDHYQRAAAAQAERDNELACDDSIRFAGLERVEATISVAAAERKPISDMLLGIFFEDINYAADGGLCAELLQNGDFEYAPSDRRGDTQWTSTTAWSVEGTLTTSSDIEGVSDNNRHALLLHVDEGQQGAVLCNNGWDGIPVRKGASYDLSIYIKGGGAAIAIMDGNRTLAETTVHGGDTWTKAIATLTPLATCDTARLAIRPLEVGEIAIDMVSLMPHDTYKGHGIRKDLAEALAALHPRFMRFPGGCVAHGDGIDNIYRWKETIGPVEQRKPARNIWNYHQSRRLGFYELFQFCEDMGMEPLPVVAAGVPCQNSRTGGKGQQGGIPLSEMDAYIQDVLDLIEWANGDETTPWGRKRIEQGHKEPFHLKMIGIGNEDLISPTFLARYLPLCRAVKERYPDILVCGTVGPYYYGADYDAGWQVANDNSDIIDMVDEHYYLPPAWYIYHQDFYDMYDRSAPQVYLGEWAAHTPARTNTIETALAEALYFCSIERNGDVVRMSSYAPLLAREGHTQWNPNMLYFNGTEVLPTVTYFAQQMLGNSQGNEYLDSRCATDETRHGVRERIAVSTVRDSATGKTYMKVVNLLPVEVDAHLLLQGLLDDTTTCRTTTLTGNYDSTTARPVEGVVSLSADCHVAFPAYSFTIIDM